MNRCCFFLLFFQFCLGDWIFSIKEWTLFIISFCVSSGDCKVNFYLCFVYFFKDSLSFVLKELVIVLSNVSVSTNELTTLWLFFVFWHPVHIFIFWNTCWVGIFVYYLTSILIYILLNVTSAQTVLGLWPVL